MFPSPCGDYGSYLARLRRPCICRRRRFRPLAGIMVLIMTGVLKKPPITTWSFRPLAGIMVLINYRIMPQRYLCKHVSVPLRGLWFLSAVFEEVLGINVPSFRPLAGIMVLITASNTNISAKAVAVFPSPCGDYGSYHVATALGYSNPSNAFPSPCGDYGSYLR